jgi:phosphoadenosine phosphosulfate reductase
MEIGRTILQDAVKRFRRPAILWTGGKDSTLLLGLMRAAQLPIPPCIFIDHDLHFPEVLRFVDEVAGKWGLEVLRARNEDAIARRREHGRRIPVKALSEENQRELRRVGFKGRTFDYTLNSVEGNHLLKTMALNRFVAAEAFDGLYLGIRWDEHPARATERFLRTYDKPRHHRAFPILHFNEVDVWDATFRLGLPVCDLYRQGYRSLDSTESKKLSDVPAWEQELGRGERAGREQQKEDVMERLRALGYM